MDLGTQVAQQASKVDSDLPVIAYRVVVRPEQRPSALLPLYAAQGVMQGLDLYTTFRALDAGNREANPIFKSKNRTAMACAKVAAASMNILAAEKVWKAHRTAAVLLMVVTNTMMSAVVANNINVMR